MTDDNTKNVSKSSTIPSKFEKVATLCTASDVTIGSQDVLGVDANALHQGLGVETPFHKWISRRIKALGFENGIDYEVLDSSVRNPEGGRPAQGYTLTLDAAKHIAMVEKNEMGRLVRDYFVWVEKKARQQHAVLTPQIAGGVFKGVVNKALAPFEERQKQLEARLDAVMSSYDPSCAFVTDYHPMSHVVNNHGIPQNKRRPIVVKCSNRCAKFLQRNGMGGMIRCTRERNTRIFHRDGIEKWLLAEGKELLLNARDVALGQRAMRFSTIKGGKA